MAGAHVPQRGEHAGAQPGVAFSRSASMRPMTLRCRLSCEPQRSHGKMGNCFSAAKAAMSSSAQ